MTTPEPEGSNSANLRHPAESYISRLVELKKEKREIAAAERDIYTQAGEAGHGKLAIRRTVMRILENDEQRLTREATETESDQQLLALGFVNGKQGDLFEDEEQRPLDGEVIPPGSTVPAAQPAAELPSLESGPINPGEPETDEEAELDPTVRGEVACRRGADAGANPYPAGSVDAQLWRAGWTNEWQAKREAKNGGDDIPPAPEAPPVAPKRSKGRPKKNANGEARPEA